MPDLFQWGYMGLFLACFLAATIVPFSSEGLLSLMMVSGYDPLALFLVATSGNWLGGMSSFFLGYLGKWEMLEKYFKMPREKVEKFSHKIYNRSAFLAFFCWLPFVGDLIAIALGFLRCNLWLCAFFMLAGKAIRYLVWMQLSFAVFG